MKSSVSRLKTQAQTVSQDRNGLRLCRWKPLCRPGGLLGLLSRRTSWCSTWVRRWSGSTFPPKLKEKSRLLTITRGHEPFKGLLALPGGFVEPGETPRQAAARELFEETNVFGLELQELGVWAAEGRDPRGPVTTTAFTARAPQRLCRAGDDAAAAHFRPLTELSGEPWSFDHRDIVMAALRAAQDLPGAAEALADFEAQQPRKS